MHADFCLHQLKESSIQLLYPFPLEIIHKKIDTVVRFWFWIDIFILYEDCCFG